MQLNLSTAALLLPLQEACRALSIPISQTQQDQLLNYLQQLLKWNHTYNLTAIRDPHQALVQHLFDSLSVVPPMKRYFGIEQKIQPTILDVGSGAGLPGIVLAIMFPTISVTCVDAVEKKSSFMTQMSSVLTLTNLITKHARVEQLLGAQYNVVVSRAFASLEDFANLAGERVCAQGVLLAMKGKRPNEEIQALQQNTEWCVERLEPLIVPQLDAERCLLWIKRKGS